MPLEGLLSTNGMACLPPSTEHRMGRMVLTKVSAKSTAYRMGFSRDSGNQPRAGSSSLLPPQTAMQVYLFRRLDWYLTSSATCVAGVSMVTVLLK